MGLVVDASSLFLDRKVGGYERLWSAYFDGGLDPHVLTERANQDPIFNAWLVEKIRGTRKALQARRQQAQDEAHYDDGA